MTKERGHGPVKRATVVTETPLVKVPVPLGFAEYWSQTHPQEEAVDALGFLRDEEEVLSAETMRLTAPSCISFTRSLIRRMHAESWRISTCHADIDGEGVGSLVYLIEAAGECFHFGVFARPTGTGPRHGRLRENEFDFFGALMDGPPNLDRLARENEEAAAQVWSGRTSSDAYGWTFANRSERIFDHVIDSLAEGTQPDQRRLASAGYLIRNAGFYGNGRHGTRAWQSIPAGHPLDYPYHMDLLCLYLWRQAGFDIVESAARARSTSAVGINSDTKRSLGVGNASGIGTIAALVRWPSSLSGFTFAREYVLAYAKSQSSVESERLSVLSSLVDARRRILRQIGSRESANIPDRKLIGGLDLAFELISEIMVSGMLADKGPGFPLLGLCEALRESESVGREVEEEINALIIDTYHDIGEIVSGFLPRLMKLRRDVDPTMGLIDLRRHLSNRFGWALVINLNSEGTRRHFWYKSEENGENRRGVREIDPGVEYETFVDVVGAIQSLEEALRSATEHTVGHFLLMSPEHAMAVSRVQLAAALPYSELHENIIGANFAPNDAIHFFLSVLGADRAENASAQWVRCTFFERAPLAEELGRAKSTGEFDGCRQVAESGGCASLDGDRSSICLSYPEIRRVSREALRVAGFPLAVADEAADVLAWTEAAVGGALEFVVSLDATEALADVREVKSADDTTDLDCSGGSLLRFGMRIADFACAAASRDGGRRIVIRRTEGKQFLWYLVRRCASQGFVATAVFGGPTVDGRGMTSCIEGIPARDGADKVLFKAGPPPTELSAELAAAWEESVDGADPVIAIVWVRREVQKSIGLDLTYRAELIDVKLDSRVALAIRHGVVVPTEVYKEFMRLVSGVRVPTSERSRAQAG